MEIYNQFAALAAVTTGSVIGLLWAERTDSQGLRWLFKPVAAIAFVFAALSVGAWQTAFGQWILVGLIFSVLGDLFLIPRRVGPYFAMGLSAFLLGHIAYAGACIVYGIDWSHTAGAGLVFSVVAWFIFKWLAPDVPPKLKVAVGAYIVVITAMVTLAFGTQTAIFPIAAMMFWLSDISVARGRFKDAGFSNKLWGIPLYFGSQLVFGYACLT